MTLTRALTRPLRRELVYVDSSVPPEYPEVVNVTSRTSANNTSHSVTLGDTYDAGDLILIITAGDGFSGGVTSTADTSWIKIAEWFNDAGTCIYKKKAVGDEGGATVTFTTPASEYVAAQIWRISPWSGSLNDVVVGTLETGTSYHPDPPSLTSGFGGKRTLWIATCTTSTASALVGPPDGYSAAIESGALGTGNAQVRSAWKKSTNNVEDPGQFTGGSTALWCATTLAIKGVG